MKRFNDYSSLIFIFVLVPSLLLAQKRHRFGLEEVRKEFKVDRSTPCRIRVEVDAGEVRVARGRSKDQVRVELAYSRNEFHHSFEFQESRNELEIRLSKESWFEHDSERTTAALDLELPNGAELELDFTIKAGEIDMELGGLKLADFALETVAGEVNVDFDEPNQIKMRNLHLNVKIGESNFRRLGNARFEDAEINGGIGEMTIDFSGDILKDVSAHVDLDIGETTIILPREAGTKIAVSKFLFLSDINLPYDFRKEGRYYYSHNYNRADHTFSLRVNSGVGECRFEY